jgi:hypothetical protein
MSTWYRVYKTSTEIGCVDVEKETDCFIWIAGKGVRSAKRTDYWNYFPSLEEAVAFQRRALKTKIAGCAVALNCAQIDLTEFEERYAKGEDDEHMVRDL